MEEQNRTIWLDVVRIVACFLVCTIHSPMPNGRHSLCLSLCNYLSAPCIGLFFMVSGALLFPVRQPLRLFLKKRLFRILFPLFVWSCVSVATHYLLGDISGETAIRKILCIPFSPVDGVYWFLYAILGLYLFAPLISPALENLAHAKYLLLLWGITLVMPYVNGWIPGTWDLNGNVRHVLGSFSGYLGYMVLGYYLRYMPISWNHLLARFYAPGLVLAILIPAYFINGRHASVTNDMLYGYLTINVAALAFIYFTLIMGVSTISCARLMFRGGGRHILLHQKNNHRPFTKKFWDLSYTHSCHAAVSLAVMGDLSSNSRLRCPNSHRVYPDVRPLLSSD